MGRLSPGLYLRRSRGDIPPPMPKPGVELVCQNTPGCNRWLIETPLGRQAVKRP